MTENEIAIVIENLERRVKTLEEKAIDNLDLIISVKELTVSVKNLTESHNELKAEFKAEKNKDGETWNKVKFYILTTILGLILGSIAGKLF